MDRGSTSEDDDMLLDHENEIRQSESQPSSSPTNVPSEVPSHVPTNRPTNVPSIEPSLKPSSYPSYKPTSLPTYQPSDTPSVTPSEKPSQEPSLKPTNVPSTSPTTIPTSQPSTIPSQDPSSTPSIAPSDIPSITPTQRPTQTPSIAPTKFPSTTPTITPTLTPTITPTSKPSASPSHIPTTKPTSSPSSKPSQSTHPSHEPSSSSAPPTFFPSNIPTFSPSKPPIINLFDTKHPTYNSNIDNLKSESMAGPLPSNNQSSSNSKITSWKSILIPIGVFTSLITLILIFIVMRRNKKRPPIETPAELSITKEVLQDDDKEIITRRINEFHTKINLHPRRKKDINIDTSTKNDIDITTYTKKTYTKNTKNDFQIDLYAMRTDKRLGSYIQSDVARNKATSVLSPISESACNSSKFFVPTVASAGSPKKRFNNLFHSSQVITEQPYTPGLSGLQSLSYSESSASVPSSTASRSKSTNTSSISCNEEEDHEDHNVKVEKVEAVENPKTKDTMVSSITRGNILSGWAYKFKQMTKKSTTLDDGHSDPPNQQQQPGHKPPMGKSSSSNLDKDRYKLPRANISTFPNHDDIDSNQSRSTGAKSSRGYKSLDEMIRKTSSSYSNRDRYTDDTNTNTRTTTNAGYTTGTSNVDSSRDMSTVESSCLEYSVSGDGSTTMHSRSVMSTTVDGTDEWTIDETVDTTSIFANL